MRENPTVIEDSILIQRWRDCEGYVPDMNTKGNSLCMGVEYMVYKEAEVSPPQAQPQGQNGAANNLNFRALSDNEYNDDRSTRERQKKKNMRKKDDGCTGPPWWGTVIILLVLANLTAIVVLEVLRLQPGILTPSVAAMRRNPRLMSRQEDTPQEKGEYIGACSNASKSGVYTIDLPYQHKDIQVYCQVDKLGKWTVIQRRLDGSVDFYRTWNDYRRGFGNLRTEFWLGNDYIHSLSVLGYQELRVDIEDWEGTKFTVTYDMFRVAGLDDQFRVKIGGFTGTSPPGDALLINDEVFFTYDIVARGTNCPALYGGGWWYHVCHEANPNGWYNDTAHGRGINWKHWKGYFYSLKAISMMLRINEG